MSEVVVIFAILTLFAVAILGILAYIKMQPVDLSKVKDLAEVLPIQCIEKDFIINGNGDITAGFKLFLPEVFTQSELDAKECHNAFVGLLKKLSPGIIVHKQDYFFLNTYIADLNVENIIHKENLQYYNGRPTYCNYSNIYVTFTAKQSFSKEHNISLQLSPNYPFKQQFKGFTLEKFEEIKNYIAGFENGLKGIKGYKALRMVNSELRDAIYDYINMSWDTPSTDSSDKVVNPIGIDDFDGSLRIGKKFVAVLSLKEEGSRLDPFKEPITAPGSVYNNGIQYSNEIKSKTSMIFPLACGLPIDHVVNTVIEITNNDQMISHLKSKKKELNFIANFYTPARTKQNIIQTFIDTIENSSKYNTCFTSFNVVLANSNKQQLQKMITLTEGAFMNMNHATCLVENIDTANCLFATLPGNANSIYRNFINTTEQAVCYLNKESLYISDASGFIFNDRFGNPIVVDMWDNPKLNNRNKLVFGPSGSGKSYFINGLVNQSLYAGNHVIIIDIGHSYRRNCELNNGKYFDSGDRKKLSFNIFLCDKDKQGNYVYLIHDEGDKDALNDRVDFIYTVIAAICIGTREATQVEVALYKKSIVDFYKYVNKNKIFPDIIEYSKFVEIFNETLEPEHKVVFKVKDIILMLDPFVNGQYKNLLNAERNIDILEDKFLVFDLEQLLNLKDIFAIVSIIIMQIVCDKIRVLKGIKKSLTIDEGFNFLENKLFGTFIGNFYRTIRKKEGEIYLAAQNVMFLENIDAEIRNSILINTSTKILLDHTQHRATYPAIQSILSFTDHDIKCLDSIQNGPGYREFAIKMEDKMSIMRMEVSPFADAVFTSKEVEVTKIEKLFERFRSLPTALYQYLEDKKSNLTNTQTT